MPQQIASSVQNTFTGGLKTEFTGLNFPENSCTEVDNCLFSVTGEISRRLGIDFETGHTVLNEPRTGLALNTYKWKNAGGNGNTELLVVQIGYGLLFYRSSDGDPVSGTYLGSTPTTAIDFSLYAIPGTTFVGDTECQFADGNGHLFVFHPGCDPFYVVYDAGTVTPNKITVKVRDFVGAFENIPVTFRPTPGMDNMHFYNLQNQGWTEGSAWQASDTSHTVTIGTGVKVFTVAAALAITPGDSVQIVAEGLDISLYPGVNPVMSGQVTAYAGTSLTVNVTYASIVGLTPVYTIQEISTGHLQNWYGAFTNFPSNSDVWWRFKNSSEVFDPLNTAANIPLGTSNSQRGHFILDAFNMDRGGATALSGISTASITVRPSVGTWFQGRVWYSGVNGSFPATSSIQHYSWSENIYFSQVVETTNQVGLCYQENDPTDEEFFDLLPTDGGVIVIQGSGSIYKLFPIQNGLLVFAANGIWFITGSQGIGFSSNDYTVTKISSIKSISGTSFVNVEGFPMFWNEEGIYSVSVSEKGGGLVVNNLCLGSISNFFSEIPTVSKKYVRGDYSPLDYVIKWVYRNTSETDVTTRYEFDRVLNYDISIKAFYPYSVAQETGKPTINDVNYMTIPGTANSRGPVFKYWVSYVNGGAYSFTFAEENDNVNWEDFNSFSEGGISYESFFVTGYRLGGKALMKFQPVYVQMFSVADVPTAYKIQGIWDYANSPNSGRYSNIQVITNALTRYGILVRRHKIRGRGLALQLKITSVDGFPFDIIGWSSLEAQSGSV